MEVVADKSGFREGFRHEYGRKSMPAANVGNGRATFELRHGAVQRRQPRGHQIVLITWTEEPSRRAEQTLRLVAPADAFPTAEGRLDQRLILHHYHSDVEAALQIDGTVGLSEHHRLFRRQGELAGSGVVFEVPG